jgi:hypothetical protein
MIVIDETAGSIPDKEAGIFDGIKRWWGKGDKPTSEPTSHEPPPTDVPLEDDADDVGPDIEESLQPEGDLPPKDFDPYDPLGSEYELVEAPPSKWDEENKTLPTASKIWIAMGNNEDHETVPLRIVYTTIKGHTTERTVRPDHVHWAKGHAIMVAWCEMRNDWRAFIVDRITKSKLEG